VKGAGGKLGRAEKSGIERVVIKLRRRRKEREDEGEETNCHLHAMSMGGGFHSLQVPICQVHRDDIKRLCKAGLKIA
jgi:hypothetical protein